MREGVCFYEWEAFGKLETKFSVHSMKLGSRNITSPI